MKFRDRSLTALVRSEPARDLLVAGLAALAIVVALAGCSSEAAPVDALPPPPEVSVATVLSKPVRHWDDFTGHVTAAESVEVRPRVSGYVERVAYKEGQEIRKGDLLFVIDPRPYRAALARAQARLAQAQSEATLAVSQDRRAQALVEARALSRAAFEARKAAVAQAEAAVRAAQAEVEAARLELQFTEVRSPIDGRAGRAMATVGNLAQADTTVLTTVVSQDPVHVYFETDEQTFLRYGEMARRGERDRSANPVRVGLANEVGHPHQGVVDFIDNRVDPTTGTIRARAVLRNPDRVFTPGLFARVRLQGSGEIESMLVDARAILTDQDRKYVYVLGPEDRALRKDVVTGRTVELEEDGVTRRLQVVESGLEPTDRVIVHGFQKIFMPGMPVKPHVVAMGAPPSDGRTRVADAARAGE
jgi:multidrug efflux system membrane fusion protein